MHRRILYNLAGLLIACLLLLSGSTAPAVHCKLPVTLTAYTHSGQPTASGRLPQVGMVALSRDLERDLQLRFGAKLRLEGLGTVSFQDRMHTRWTKRVDLFMADVQAARRFGKRPGVLLLDGPGCPTR